jgi:tight adherence protein C
MFVILPLFISLSGSPFWVAVVAGGILGYVGPSLYIDRRISQRRNEHRAGFPDFMDLLVVCADSGLESDHCVSGIDSALFFPANCLTTFKIRQSPFSF